MSKKRHLQRRLLVSGAMCLFGSIVAFTCVSQRVAPRAPLPSPISESALRAHIKFLSDDRLEGRGTGARGGELAALYCAQQFEAMGLKGAGPKGSYWQGVSLVGVKADPKTELHVSGSRGSETFKFADDFVVFLLPFMGKLIQLIESSTDFLHALGQAVGHSRRDRGLVMAVDKPLLFQVP